MEILSKDRYQEYEDFVSTHRYGGFMQSLSWAKVKDNWGHEVVVARNDDGQIIGAMLVLIRKMPLGASMLYAPRGPVCDYSKPVLADLLEGAKALAQKYHAILFKCDPYVEETEPEKIQNFIDLGFQHTPGAAESETLQRRYNYILPDIGGKTKDEVFASFSQKARYNVRVALKHGVECKVCGKEGLDDWMRLSRLTAQRDNFIDRPKEYCAKMMDAFGENIRLYLCYYQGQAISGAITSQYAGKTCYIFGASDNAHRNVMPNYLMQWEMIQWAIEGGCYLYDFLGIPVNCDPNSPMYGVYEFKKKFNGRVAPYAGEFDYIFRPCLNSMFHTAQNLRRSYYSMRKKRQAKHNVNRG